MSFIFPSEETRVEESIDAIFSTRSQGIHDLDIAAIQARGSAMSAIVGFLHTAHLSIFLLPGNTETEPVSPYEVL